MMSGAFSMRIGWTSGNGEKAAKSHRGGSGLWNCLRIQDGENPAKWEGGLKLLMPKQAKGGNHAAMAWKDVPAFMARLSGVEGNVAKALAFNILTAARTSETLGARWDEIDFEARTWTIPADRMKAGVSHRVALSEQAMAVLESMRRIAKGELVFPSARPAKLLSNMSMAAVLKRLDVKETVHGFRSSFRDWGSDQSGHDGETLERALAHKVGDKVEAAYLRSDRLEKRVLLMQQWGDFCSGKEVSDNVVAFAKR